MRFNRGEAGGGEEGAGALPDGGQSERYFGHGLLYVFFPFSLSLGFFGRVLKVEVCG